MTPLAMSWQSYRSRQIPVPISILLDPASGAELRDSIISWGSVPFF